MNSYAPLFVNVNPGGMQWATDLIGYNALSSYGSPSYWTQVMFSTHLGTEVVSYARSPTRRPASMLSSTRDEATHKLFIKMVNANSTAQPLAIDLTGVKKASAAGHADHHERQNAQRDQQHHQPQRRRSGQAHTSRSPARSSLQTFAPYSVNVLELSY